MENLLRVINYGAYAATISILLFGRLAYMVFKGKNQIISKLREENEQLRNDVSELKAIRDALVKELKGKETYNEAVSEMINKERAGLAVSLAPKSVDIYEEELDN